jgi:hypothetical protein
MSVSDLFCEHCGTFVTWVYPRFPQGQLPRTAEGARAFARQLTTKQIGFCSQGCRTAYLKDLDRQIEETKQRISVLGDLTLGELTEELKQEYVDQIQKVIDLLKIRVDL